MKTQILASLLVTLSLPGALLAQDSTSPARQGLPVNSTNQSAPKIDPSPAPEVAPAATPIADTVNQAVATVPVLTNTGPAPMQGGQETAQNGAQPQPATPTDATAPVAPAAGAQAPAAIAPATPEAAASPLPASLPKGSTSGAVIKLNFQGAQLTEVLNYLSESAGFVIVEEVPVTGTVNVLSKQPMTADEAVDLLNTVLLEKNLIALRNGRILKIVSRTDAQKRDLPVIMGSDPDQIPRKDNVVTQILPVHFADVAKLIDNLRPLLADNASISANDASNAIILTDSQTNVKRMAEIIKALDTSISGISSIHVFPLRYADAKELADVLTQLFQPTTGASGAARAGGAGGGRGGRGGGGGGGGFGGGGFGGGGFGGGGFGGGGGGFGGGGGGGNGGAGNTQSEARQAESRVIAVADQATNSVIVSAPDDYMASISEVVSRLDTSITEISETRIFRLLHADATEMAGILSTLYGDSSTSTSSQAGNRGGGQRGGGGGAGGGGGGGATSANSQLSQRAILEAKMVAVADPRTNSVIITASHDSMEDIAMTVGRLDSSDSKKQHIHVYTLQSADPDNVASILRGMFTVNGASSVSQTQSTTDVLSQRTSTGASTDVINTLDTSGGAAARTGNGR